MKALAFNYFSGFVLIMCLLAQPFAQAHSYKVVLLAGQSNMAGHGNFDELDAVLHKRVLAVADRVLLSENGKEFTPLTFRRITPSEKYPYDKEFGPELMVGVLLAEQFPEETFLLIKRAQGGTSLEGAWNPHWDAEKAKVMERSELKQKMKLYSEHVKQIHSLIQSKKENGDTFEFVGLVWLQGENDAKNNESANNYGENLNTLVEAYRLEFKTQMPFVFGQTNSRYGKKGAAELVRNEMLAYSQEHLNVIMIPTSNDPSWSDYPKHKDNVHYNTIGQMRMGIAMGNALISLQNSY